MSLIFNGCSHDDRNFLVTYKQNQKSNGEKIDESPKLFCKPCCDNPDLVNDSIIDHIFNFQTGEMIK